MHWDDLKHFLATPEPPELGPARRPGTRTVSDLESDLRQARGFADLSAGQRDLLRSALLLWHDHLEESHAISQNLHSADGSFLHGIMHRREPDYGNAKYWFHRVGRHRCFPTIAEQAKPLIATSGHEALAARLIPGGEWDPFAFVDACERAGHERAPERPLLRELQRLEFETLLQAFIQPDCGTTGPLTTDHGLLTGE